MCVYVYVCKYMPLPSCGQGRAREIEGREGETAHVRARALTERTRENKTERQQIGWDRVECKIGVREWKKVWRRIWRETHATP